MFLNKGFYFINFRECKNHGALHILNLKTSMNIFQGIEQFHLIELVDF